MKPYFTCEPMTMAVTSDSADICHYTIYKVTGLTDDVPTDTETVYSGECYAPSSHNVVNFGPQLRAMIDYQVQNIKTLQYMNSSVMDITQDASSFNTYFIIDDGTSLSDAWSVIYDTRGLTAYEAGVRTALMGPGDGYAANTFPEDYITDGQYVSIMYRTPSNMRQTEPCSFGCTYCYLDGQGSKVKKENVDNARASMESANKNVDSKTMAPPPPDPSVYGSIVIANNIIDSSITGQSFRYSGPADWKEWTGNHASTALWARFWRMNSKNEKTYITPYLYPNECDPEGTMYLYYVNSMGGIDFIRSTYASVTTMNTERSTYETDYSIDNRLEFGEETYHQTRWNKYTFDTELISDDETYTFADIVNTRWAWLHIPGDIVPWRSVKITDTSAKIKYRRNEHTVYNYTFNLEDTIKAKIV